MSENETPRVWIGCLGCYNGGRLVGAWFDAIDCPTDEPQWRDAMRKFAHPVGLLREHFTEAHDELWVMDHENFGGLLKGECSPVDAQYLAGFMDEFMSEDELAAFVAFRDNLGAEYVSSDAVGRERFNDAYAGHWDSIEDYARELADDCVEDFAKRSESWPFTCIDWDHAARELVMGGDIWATEPSYAHGVYVFRSI